ncbi:(d)CMP kinase [Mycoplasmopsis caviae]|uniref:Cytidylate kinase n=1 Tax=Mycoplasmopsis caviae TaxID=55603 RepID=A0A3P8KBT7_9BACT|nr:(d)CMP kinase [Mycoplasmopsis caviae]VDR42064.1 cytidylate kinase [Mycoplasmopsis caviae]
MSKVTKINIAIDGPCGAGKSTVSQEVARRLGYVFINSGSVYRALALNAKQLGVDWNDEAQINKTLEKNIISLDEKENIFLREKNVSIEIREDSISFGSSTIATYKKVRQYVVDLIQNITKKSKGYIMDGRDTTFKIMPYAELKIFLTASPEERAMRRLNQNVALGFNMDYNKILDEVKLRDFQDMNREVDPLHKVKDAKEIDCTNMGFEAVVVNIIELVKETIERLNKKNEK